VRGDGKTAFRIGGGQFFTREEVGLAENLAKNVPWVIGATTNRPIDVALPYSSASPPSVGIAGSKTTGGFIPNSWQWNVSIEQELARNTTLQVGYVGNVGEHLTDMYDVNFIPSSNWAASTFAPSTAAFNALRPAFNFGTIGGYNRGGHANYNSLQVLFRAQTGNFSTFQAAYTWGHSIANVAEDDASGSIDSQAITNQENPGLDKGNTNINRPNIFVANEVFFLPKFASHGAFVQNTLGGWEANSIISAAEGSSLTVFSSGASGACTNIYGPADDGGNAALDGSCVPGYNSFLNSLVGTGYTANQRPLVTSIGCNAARHGDQILDNAHFTLLGYPLGTFPSNMESKGSCLGAPNTDVDGQLAKNWTFKEKYRVKFSMDFFNLFNHPNFNSGNLEGSGFTASSPFLCGGATKPVAGAGPSGQPCSATNNIVTGAASGTGPGGAQLNVPAGVGTAGAVNVADGSRQLQYTLKFTF